MDKILEERLKKLEEAVERNRLRARKYYYEHRRKVLTPEERAARASRHSEIMKQKWLDLEYRNRRMAGGIGRWVGRGKTIETE